MLHIDYCPKDQCEFTWKELKCEACEYFVHFIGYFGCDWFECTFEEINERLKIGL
jgi:hypothetical protein